MYKFVCLVGRGGGRVVVPNRRDGGDGESDGAGGGGFALLNFLLLQHTKRIEL